jgi:segregation and condensation protein A
VKRRPVFALDDALHRVEAMLGIAIEWTEIARFLPDSDDPVFRRSALASTFAAALELAKQGRAELSQADTFGPLHMKARS